MGATVRYLAIDDEDAAIWDWFDRLDAPPRRMPVQRGSILHFRELGPLAYDSIGTLDPAASPVAAVIPPRSVRTILWTADEVHFLATPLRPLFPGLHRIRRRFETWLSQFTLVHDGRPGEWDYCLEGSIRNYDPPVYAMPGALAALERRTYFVADDDIEFVLDRLCGSLALRGVTCG